MPSAYTLYLRDDEEGLKQSQQFKRDHSSHVRIKFVGVWYVIRLIGQLSVSFPFRDTVESVGASETRLPFCVSNDAIEYFRHAISLDECRVMFSPTYYHGVSQHGKAGPADDTDVKEVFFAGVHCGTLLVFSTNDRQIIYRCPSRCRRWGCAKWYTPCSRPHSPSMDD